MHKTTDEGWGPLEDYVILVLKSLFCMHKTTNEGWDPIETNNSDAKVALLNAQIRR